MKKDTDLISQINFLKTINEKLEKDISQLNEKLNQFSDEIDDLSKQRDGWQSTVERALDLDYHPSHNLEWLYLFLSTKIRKGNRSVIFNNALDALSPSVGEEIFPLWKIPCKDVFEYLAEKYPIELLNLIELNQLESCDLKLAIESTDSLKIDCGDLKSDIEEVLSSLSPCREEVGDIL
jgi:phage shock protein A